MVRFPITMSRIPQCPDIFQVLRYSRLAVFLAIQIACHTVVDGRLVRSFGASESFEANRPSQDRGAFLEGSYAGTEGEFDARSRRTR